MALSGINIETHTIEIEESESYTLSFLNSYVSIPSVVTTPANASHLISDSSTSNDEDVNIFYSGATVTSIVINFSKKFTGALHIQVMGKPS
mgnify:CR=1 FL=1